MTKVLVATDKPFAKTAVEGIKSIIIDAGFVFSLLEKYPNQSDFIEAAKVAEAIIIRSDIADRELLIAAKNLKIIVRAGAGYDNIDLQAATENNIVVMNTPGQNSNAVAELALGMMVYIARNNFDGSSGTELFGKTLGLHAYGNVSKHVARIAKGFGMTIYAYDPYVEKQLIEADGVIAVNSIEELYKKCQYISLHIPANQQTKKSINYELLSLMPKGATLINTARKEVINEEELLKIFEERPDFKYAADVEPDCKNVFSESYKNRYYFTPKKLGAQTSEANNNAGIAAARQIVDFFKNGNKTYQVNK